MTYTAVLWACPERGGPNHQGAESLYLLPGAEEPSCPGERFNGVRFAPCQRQMKVFGEFELEAA